MSKFLLISAFVFVAFNFQAFGAEVKTTIGKWKHHSGRVTLHVVEDGKYKWATMFVSDKHVIDSVLFSLEKDELENLRDLINETLDKM